MKHPFKKLIFSGQWTRARACEASTQLFDFLDGELRKSLVIMILLTPVLDGLPFFDRKSVLLCVRLLRFGVDLDL